MKNSCIKCGNNNNSGSILIDINGVRCCIDKNNCLGFFVIDITSTEYGKKNNLSCDKLKSLSYIDKLFLLEEATGMKEKQIRDKILEYYKDLNIDSNFNRI